MELISELSSITSGRVVRIFPLLKLQKCQFGSCLYYTPLHFLFYVTLYFIVFKKYSGVFWLGDKTCCRCSTCCPVVPSLSSTFPCLRKLCVAD